MVIKKLSPLLFLIPYFLISLILTYPLITDFKNSFHYFGSPLQAKGSQPETNLIRTANDTLLDLWTHWFFTNSLKEGNLPLTTNLFYGKAENPIAFSINNWLYPSFTALFRPLLGLVGSFNFLTLITLTLNGWSAFLLARSFLKNYSADFLAGIFLMASSYSYIRSQEHLGLSSIYLTTFFLLFLIKAVSNKTKGDWLVSSLFLFGN